MGTAPMRTLSIVLPITRPWRVKTMAEQIERMVYPDIAFEVILVVDNIEIPKSTIDRCFRQFQYKLHYTNLRLPSEHNVAIRRQRIANNLNTARTMLSSSEYTLLIEDDTDVEPHFLSEVFSHSSDETGIVSAVQAGRHGLYHIGAWVVDDLKEPNLFESVPYRESGVRKVDATGFYFALMKSNLFKEIEVPCEVSPVGPDVQFGLELRNRGYSNYIVDDLKCGHIEERRTVVPTKECVQVRFRKTGTQWKLVK